MAGIQEAKQLVKSGMDRGTILSLGFTSNGSRFMVLEVFDGTDTCPILQHDYGSDLKLSDELRVGDVAVLKQIDDYCAEWRIEE